MALDARYRTELLSLYDAYERKGPAAPGMRKEITPHFVRELPEQGAYWIAWCELHELRVDEVDAVLAEERRHAQRLGRPVEWKHFDHDAPADLLARLGKAGFEPQEPETLLIAPLDAIAHENTAEAGGRLEIRHPGRGGLADMAAVHSVVWPSHAFNVERFVGALLDRDEAAADVVVAYEDGVPVSAGWSTFLAGSPFVGFWGGATIPSARGRGYYQAVVHERIREAVRRGRSYATVDAAETSRPILERMGFAPLAVTTPCMANMAQGSRAGE